jgi:hypothetical protein
MSAKALGVKTATTVATKLTELGDIDHAAHIGPLQNLALLGRQATSRVKPLGYDGTFPLGIVHLLARERGMAVVQVAVLVLSGQTRHRRRRIWIVSLSRLGVSLAR